MKKQLMGGDTDFDRVLPEYGRKKLLMYADSFRDLANTFLDIQKEEEAQPVGDRQEYLWKRRLVENRDLMADHLNEMAQIMTKVAEEAYRFIHMSERKVKQLAHALKEEDVLLKEVYLLEKENGHKEIYLIMRSGKGTSPAVDEVGNLLSVLLNLRLVPSKSSSIFVGKEWGNYQYIEEPGFHVLTGVAKAVKETERMSGDNYSFLEVREGTLTAVLSDGMGSGEKACKDSEFVIDFMEKFLEAGFGKETAVQMINGALIAGGESQNMSTLDLCQMDLYTGVCEFIKIGSAPSYINFRRIFQCNLPQHFREHLLPDSLRQSIQYPIGQHNNIIPVYQTPFYRFHIYFIKHSQRKVSCGYLLHLSGGADSVCLFLMLCELAEEIDFHLAVVHVNHKIRPEAAADAAYVEELCKSRNIPFILEEKDVKEYAREKHLSEEEAGREVRYQAFEEALGKYGSCSGEKEGQGRIAVAHNANDRAETMLFHLFRGTGLTGAGGIRAVRGHIVRPLLCLRREEIEEYLGKKGVFFCIDRTNLEDTYTRNRIRNHILPFAEKEICAGAIFQAFHMRRSNIPSSLRKPLQTLKKYLFSYKRLFFPEFFRIQYDLFPALPDDTVPARLLRLSADIGIRLQKQVARTAHMADGTLNVWRGLRREDGILLLRIWKAWKICWEKRKASRSLCLVGSGQKRNAGIWRCTARENRMGVEGVFLFRKFGSNGGICRGNRRNLTFLVWEGWNLLFFTRKKFPFFIINRKLFPKRHIRNGWIMIE